MPVPRSFQQKIAAGEPSKGFWINLADAAIARIAALAGYDWVMIDAEHNPVSEPQIASVIAMLAPETPVVVRVRGNREEHIKWVLDAGAAGVIVPGVDSVDDALKAIEYTKYHPLGKRGFGPNRASDFWTQDYVPSANKEILAICQVELTGAVRDLEAICALEGIDGLWIGPGDLAQSMGHLANPGHPDVVAAIDGVIETATRLKKPWGIPTALAKDYSRYVSRGGVIMTLGSDTRVLMNGMRELIAQSGQDQ